MQTLPGVQRCWVVLEGAGVLGGASIFFWVVLRFFLGGASIFFFGWCYDFFLKFSDFFEIINFDKNFIENIYFLLFENFMYRFKNIVILFKFNCCGKFILRSSILLKTLVTVSI